MNKNTITGNKFLKFRNNNLKRFYKYIYENNLEINNENINKYVIEKYKEKSTEFRKNIFVILWELEARNIKTPDELLMFIKSNEFKNKGFKLLNDINKSYENFCTEQEIEYYTVESLELFEYEIKKILNKKRKEIIDETFS